MIIKKPYTLDAIDKANKDVWIFRFKSAENTAVDFTPGMFAMVYYRNPSTNEEEMGRAFSIASPPKANYLEFMIAMIHGKMTSKLEEAKIGDTYYISAPYGSFKFDVSEGGKFLFLAGGTGVAPFFSMLRASAGDGIDVNMLYSVKYPYEILDRDELGKLAKNLTVTVTRPAPGDNWTGQTGHIDAEMIKKYAPDFAERIPYVCGPPKFVQALKEALVSLGIEERKIKGEMWGE